MMLKVSVKKNDSLTWYSPNWNLQWDFDIYTTFAFVIVHHVSLTPWLWHSKSH